MCPCGLDLTAVSRKMPGAGGSADTVPASLGPSPLAESGDSVDVSQVSVDELSNLFHLKEVGAVEAAFAGVYR